IAVLIIPVVVLCFFVGKETTNFYRRAQSLNPLADSSSPYATTNEDHVGDVLDAFDQVKSHPILGIGLGRAYKTYRISEWKTESVEVHNGLLHVWVFYGLLGLLAYLLFHSSLFRWLMQLQAPHSDPRVRTFLQATYTCCIE